MKQFVVTITSDRGRTVCDPIKVEIGPGDIVRWTCKDGDLAVDFENDTPFTSTQVWKAIRGQLTPAAVVKPRQVSGTVFRPTISINGTMVAESLGDLIVR